MWCAGWIPVFPCQKVSFVSCFQHFFLIRKQLKVKESANMSPNFQTLVFPGGPGPGGMVHIPLHVLTTRSSTKLGNGKPSGHHLSPGTTTVPPAICRAPNTQNGHEGTTSSSSTPTVTLNPLPLQPSLCINKSHQHDQMSVRWEKHDQSTAWAE